MLESQPPCGRGVFPLSIIPTEPRSGDPRDLHPGTSTAWMAGPFLGAVYTKESLSFEKQPSPFKG